MVSGASRRGWSLGRNAVRTRRIFIVGFASVAAIGLSLAALPAHHSLRIRGSLSGEDVQAICKELRRVRWRAVYVSLFRWHFRVFWRLAKENTRLHLVSVEGDGKQAIAECNDLSNRVRETYEFTNTGGLWSFTTVSHYEGFGQKNSTTSKGMFPNDPGPQKWEAIRVISWRPDYTTVRLIRTESQAEPEYWSLVTSRIPSQWTNGVEGRIGFTPMELEYLQGKRGLK